MGFVAQLRGEKSRGIVDDALQLLRRLTHRGATGWDPRTGDGSGLSVQVPHRFLERVCASDDIELPREGRYAIGQVFLPADAAARAACEAVVERIVAEEGQHVIGWRDVPVDPEVLGPLARSVMPTIRQLFIGRRRVVPTAFQRKLYVIRKRVERSIVEQGVDPTRTFHFASLSAETLIYKGLMLPDQLDRFYADLRARDFTAGIAVVHSRFSTNTFPTWDLAQPFRYVAHNGEINTLRGNRNWMRARASQLQSAKFGGPLDRLEPIIVPGASDTAQFDNMLELLHLGGRSLPHAMMLLIPEAWEAHEQMDDERRAFYDYGSSLMEPWDGPAAMVFTDGQLVGATLDRNGLRPSRYIVTTDDRVVLASEVGTLGIPASRIVEKGRLRPGRMFLVNTVEGRILSDEEVKSDIVGRFPYPRWLRENTLEVRDLPAAKPTPALQGEELRRTQRAFGWTDEDVATILLPMARDGQEPIGSMGADVPLAVLSDQSPSLFNYFKQLFAQVTNPPIDPIREELVMSLRISLGQGGNTFEETPEACHRLHIASPLLTNSTLERIRRIDLGVFETVTLSTTYTPAGSDTALEDAVEALCDAAVEAIDHGATVLVLSDRDVDATHVPIPALLALSAVHQRLVAEGTRMQAGLIVESGEVREVHHVALLIGFGAAAVNPWLAMDTLEHLVRDEQLADDVLAGKNFRKAIEKGLRKVMSKMGISTIESYAGAQIFEAVGIARDVIERYFGGTPSRIGGVGLPELDREARQRHARGFSQAAFLDPYPLPVGGRYQWKRRGERHKWTPATIAYLQDATRRDSAEAWAEYSKRITEESGGGVTLRGLLELDEDPSRAIPLDEVESARSLAMRFVTGAMSFGSISAPAHESLAIAMNRLGGKSNTGEGGEEPARWVPDANGDSRRSAIKQIASGRFGVTAAYLAHADELQIKMAQGAKPGEGGQLPGHKVSERIAKVRHSTPGVTLISPPPHHDIYSIEDLAQLIYDLKTANPRARVSVKLVSEVGVGTVAAGVAKARADVVVISGASGGTGASPLSSLHHTGLPWELGLAEVQQVLVRNRLRGRIRVQVDGGLRNGRDVAIAALLGAEEFGFSTAPLVSLGCILLRKCHNNTCTAGIATQDPELVEKFSGDPVHVERFMLFLAEELRTYMARLGFRTLDEMIGRADLLRPRADLDHWKARTLDFGAILATAKTDDPRHQVEAQQHQLELRKDQELLRLAQPALNDGQAVRARLDIGNVDRAVGAMLAGEIGQRFGPEGLPDNTIRFDFDGSAGQSFGAFLARGVTFALQGEANDYVGKGLSGGRLIVRRPADARYRAEENIIVGNTSLYGATSGEVFIEGVAGERFAVRNSGAIAVVEGVGDHGCEYMTGGVVVVLGETGRNFAAGMSGGIAFVFDHDGRFASRCNPGMVDLESVTETGDLEILERLVEAHTHHTRSELGARVLDNWELWIDRFVKVMPREYKRVLQRQRAAAVLRRRQRLEVLHG